MVIRSLIYVKLFEHNVLRKESPKVENLNEANSRLGMEPGYSPHRCLVPRWRLPGQTGDSSTQQVFFPTLLESEISLRSIKPKSTKLSCCIISSCPIKLITNSWAKNKYALTILIIFLTTSMSFLFGISQHPNLKMMATLKR